MAFFSDIKTVIKDILCPPVCAVCGINSSGFVCRNCAEKIEFLGDDICLRCGTRIAGGVDKKNQECKICVLCRNEPYSFYRARSYSIYGREISAIIKKFKYRGLASLKEILLFFLISAFKNYYCSEEIDYIETVPEYSGCHPYGGANTCSGHMMVLADGLSERLKIPFAGNAIKIKPTHRQQELDRNLRRSNILDAFKVRNCLKTQGKNFLLVDDVFTTGWTVNELSKSLKNSGAGRIYVLTIARGI